MKISLSKLKLIAIYFMVFYILNKELFDYAFGGFAKNIYYVVVYVGALCGIVKILLNSSNLKTATIFYILYSIVVLINGLQVEVAEQRRVGYITYITYFFAFFAMYYYFNGVGQMTSMFKTIIKWGVVISFLAVYEYIAVKPVLSTMRANVYKYYDGSSSYRAVVFCGSPMILSIILASLLILAIYYYHFEGERKYVFYAIAYVLGIFATGSRAPLIWSIAAIAIMYYLFFRDGLAKRNTYIILSVTFFGAILVVLLFILVPNFKLGIPIVDNIISRFSSVFNFSTEWGNLERLNRWEYYIGRFIENPLDGIGIAATSGEVSTNLKITNHGVTTESGLLARLVEIGLPGTLLYYAFLISVFKYVIKERRVTSEESKVINDRYYIIAIFSLIMLEDLVLQVSLDIFVTFILSFVLSYGVNLRETISKKERNRIHT